MGKHMPNSLSRPGHRWHGLLPTGAAVASFLGLVGVRLAQKGRSFRGRATLRAAFQGLQYLISIQVVIAGKPGERFGAGRGIAWKTPPDATPGRFGDRDSQITFYRHDRPHKIEEPRGQASLCTAQRQRMLQQKEREVADPEKGRRQRIGHVTL